MKTLILFYTLIFISINTFAQKWEPYNVDDSIQVLLPKDFAKKDTLSQEIISANTGYGTILIIKTPDNPKSTPDIEKKKHLERYYSDYVKKVGSASNGKISDEKDTVIGNLQVKDFTLEVDSGSGKQMRHFRILHENSATYAFEFLYEEIRKEYALPEKEQFFNSIKSISNATLKDQFTEPENTTGKAPAGNKSNYIIGGIFALIVIVVLILVFRRKR